jgi:hypothetical protein
LGLNATFELTRADLAELLAPLLAETLRECTRVLEAADLSWPDLDAVVPVGGSSRLPLVAETIARHTGADRVPVYKVDDPELAVAHGAVLHAYRLQAAAQRPAPSPRPATAPPPHVSEEPSHAPASEEGTPVPEPVSGADEGVFSGEGVSGDGVMTADGPGTDTDAASEQDVPPAPGPGDRPETVRFHARNMRNVARAWRWETAVWWVSALAVIAAVIDFGDWFTSRDSGSLVTQERLTMSVSALAAFSGMVMALAARSLDRALVSWRPMATAAGATFAIAATYHFLDGWLPKVGLAALIILAIGAVILADDISTPKSRYVSELVVDQLGLTVTMASGEQRHIPWNEIQVLELDRLHRLVAKPASTPTDLQYSPLSYNRVEDRLVLFSRHHFAAPDEVSGALRLHGGERVGDLWN